jgi:hypothetical protein
VRSDDDRPFIVLAETKPKNVWEDLLTDFPLEHKCMQMVILAREKTGGARANVHCVELRCRFTEEGIREEPKLT